MEWLKKFWRLMTNPSFNVVRILAVIALGMFIILFLIYISLFIGAMRERSRYMAQYQQDVRNLEKPRVPENNSKPLTFNVNESKKIGNIVIVDVTVHNPADNQVYFVTTDFRLKDERMMLCSPVSDAHLLEKEQKSALPNIDISPKEDIRGILMFSCADPAVKEFILSYQSQNERIVPKEFK